MGNLEEMEDSLDDCDLDTLIDRLKPKPRMAMNKMREDIGPMLEYHDTRIHGLTNDVYSLNKTVEHLKSELESKIPKPLKIDSSKVPNDWESDQAFNKRWPWIRIDKKTSRVTCERCSKTEYHAGCFQYPTDNFLWFVNTHGACPVIHKKETT